MNSTTSNNFSDFQVVLQVVRFRGISCLKCAVQPVQPENHYMERKGYVCERESIKGAYSCAKVVGAYFRVVHDFRLYLNDFGAILRSKMPVFRVQPEIKKYNLKCLKRAKGCTFRTFAQMLNKITYLKSLNMICFLLKAVF
jgi:hypothetical protein